MISEIYWLVPKHVLYWKMTGEIPASEIVEMSDFIAEQMNVVTRQKVHLVINTIGIMQIEHDSFDAKLAFQRLAKQQWIGKVVAISHNVQIQMQLSSLNRAFGLNWHTVSAMEDAIRFLKNSDTLLNTVPQLLQTTPISRPY